MMKRAVPVAVRPVRHLSLIHILQKGESIEEITKGYKNYDYYHEAYDAVLGGMVGEYQIGNGEFDQNDQPILETKYGLKAYSPIAYGFSFSPVSYTHLDVYKRQCVGCGQCTGLCKFGAINTKEGK